MVTWTRPFRLLLVAACALRVASLDAAATAPAVAQVLGGVPASSAPVNTADYKRLDFELLGGFPFTPPPDPDPKKPDATPPSTLGQIPAAIKAFDGQKVVITGFMLPDKVNAQGLVTDFGIVDPKVNFRTGDRPRINQMLIVRTAHGAKETVESPVTCAGTLHAHEQFNNGYLESIYQLDADSITEDSAAILNATPVVTNGYAELDFDRLTGFPFTPIPFDSATAKPGTQPPSSADQIPASIKKFDGQKAVLTGVMLATKMKNGLVTEFMLFGPKYGPVVVSGVGPPINDWVIVEAPKGVKNLIEDLISCSGTLHVREQFDQGYLTGIYQLDAETVTIADKRP